MIRELSVDFEKMKGFSPSFLRILHLAFSHSGYRAVFLYRIGHWLRRKNMRLMAIFCEKIMHHLCNCWISTNAVIGQGFVIRHVGTIVIGGRVTAGENLDIRQGITLGGNMGKTSLDGRSQPKLGNNVLIGAGAKILGPVEIGDNCLIGANAVVTKDFECDSIIGGIPAILIRKKLN
ncbi:serine O-acetyltransferase [Sphingobacterium hotanense]|uniref:serine O-acetyltransferase n=1 Tax=Sphingobacterium hotanense TaxID=649196 RepID=UPI0011F1218D|nr:serine O-acetyltransferase [Sphingobacterium hotanense]